MFKSHTKVSSRPSATWQMPYTWYSISVSVSCHPVANAYITPSFLVPHHAHRSHLRCLNSASTTQVSPYPYLLFSASVLLFLRRFVRLWSRSRVLRSPTGVNLCWRIIVVQIDYKVYQSSFFLFLFLFCPYLYISSLETESCW